MPPEHAAGGPGARPGPSLRSLAHDLSNLAYRLSFLTANLEAQIPGSRERGEATALLQDTTRSLERIVARLREMSDDG